MTYYNWFMCVCVCVCARAYGAQVWFREGIQPRVPEGVSWEEVEVPKEVAQVSAGPGDLLWALLWDGNLMVRTGLTLDTPTGNTPPRSPGPHTACHNHTVATLNNNYSKLIKLLKFYRAFQNQSYKVLHKIQKTLLLFLL